MWLHLQKDGTGVPEADKEKTDASKFRKILAGALWINVKRTTQIAISLMLLAISTAPTFTAKAIGQSAPANRTLPQLVVQSGHTDGVLTSAFSPDSKLIATGGRDNAIRIWDVKSGRLIKTLFGHKDPVRSLAFNSDGTQLVSGGMDDLVITWDVWTGNLIGKFVNTSDTMWLKKFGYNAVEQVGFAPDKTIFARYTDQSLISWMPKDPQIAPLMKGLVPPNDISPVEFHKTPGGRTDGSRHGNVLKPVQARLFLQMADGQFPTSSFATDLHCLALAIPSRHALVCNTFSGEGAPKDWILKDSDTTKAPLAFAYKKPLAAVEIGSKLFLFDMTTGKKTRQLAMPLPVRSYSAQFLQHLSKTGKTPAQVEAVGLQEVAQLRRVDGVNRFSCAFSPDDTTIVVSDALGRDDGQTATIIDTTSGAARRTLTGHTKPITSIIYSPDAETIATTSEDKTIRLWNATTGALTKTLGRPNNAINAVAFSPDSKQIVAASENGSLYFWNPLESSEPERKPIGNSAIKCLRFSRDGLKIASGSDDASVHITSAVTGKTGASVVTASNSIGSLCFSDDGKSLTVATEKEHCLTSYASGSGKKLSEQFLPGIADRVAVSPDGRRMAFGDGLGTIQICDGTTKRIVQKIQAFKPYLLNDEADIYLWSIAFSNDGKFLAASDDLGNAKVWNSETGQLTYSFPKQATAITALAFSQADSKLAIGTTSGAVTIFDLSHSLAAVRLGNLQNKITSLAFNKSNAELVSACENGLVTLWDTVNCKQLCGMVALPADGTDSWAVMTPEGRFDTNNLEQISSLAWVLPEAPLNALPPEIFLRQYFEPNLLPRIIKEDQFSALPDLQKLTTVQPVITNLLISQNKESADQVDVSVSFQSSQETSPEHKERRSGVYDLKLFRDGQLVGYLNTAAKSSQVNSESVQPVDLTQGSDAEQTRTFTVKLPQNGATKFNFTAYAFNGDRVKSETKSSTFELQKPGPIKKGRAFVIACGINDFEDPEWSLSYAAADARAFTGVGATKSQLLTDLESSGNYSQVVAINILSDRNQQGELRATKACIKDVILTLSGKTPLDANTAKCLQNAGLSQAQPEDFVLLSFSTHGATDKETGEFYLFPSDIGKVQNAGLTNDLKSHGISSTEMADWLKDLDVANMTMIIDACHSGAASGKEFKPGPMDSPGLGQLAYYKKMRLLFASQAANSAQERDSLGHGLLTYALLNEGLAPDGRAYAAPGDRIIHLTEWLKFARDEVPRLDSGENNSVNSQRRDLIRENNTTTIKPSFQTPSLLDFSQKTNDVVIFKINK